MRKGEAATDGDSFLRASRSNLSFSLLAFRASIAATCDSLALEPTEPSSELTWDTLPLELWRFSSAVFFGSGMEKLLP